jgi:hypothetical protein
MPYGIDCRMINFATPLGRGDRLGAKTCRRLQRLRMLSPNSLLQGISQGIFEKCAPGTRKANDYRTYFNPKSREQGILREF